MANSLGGICACYDKHFDGRTLLLEFDDFRMVQGRIELDKNFREERSCAEILCIRGTKRLDDGTYQFTRDVRLNLVSCWMIQCCITTY